DSENPTNEATSAGENLTNEAAEASRLGGSGPSHGPLGHPRQIGIFDFPPARREGVGTIDPVLAANNKDGSGEVLSPGSGCGGDLPTDAEREAEKVIDLSPKAIEDRRQVRAEQVRQLRQRAERVMARYRAERKANSEARQKKDLSAKDHHDHQRKTAAQEWQR